MAGFRLDSSGKNEEKFHCMTSFPLKRCPLGWMEEIHQRGSKINSRKGETKYEGVVGTISALIHFNHSYLPEKNKEKMSININYVNKLI